MSYAVIVRKKIRMCLRFGHVPPNNAQRRVERKHPVGWHLCFRCGELVAIAKGGA